MHRRGLSALLAFGVVVAGVSCAGCLGCQKEPPPELPPTAQPSVTPTEAKVPPAPPPVADALADAGSVSDGGAPAEAGGKGSVTGEVLFTGTPPTPEPLKRGLDPICAKTVALDESIKVSNGKLANVVVRIVDAPRSSAPAEPVTVNQAECLYHPRVQGAVKGQDLVVTNSDKTLHNVHTYDGTKTVFNRAQPALGAPLKEKVDAKGVVRLKCDVHPWMTGYVVYSDNAFFATTRDDGRFELKDVPAGTYTLEAWHEKLGTRTAKVTITSAAPATVSFSY